MTEATSRARFALTRGIAVVVLVFLALLAAPPQAAHADGVISGVTEDQAGTPVSVPVFLFTSPGGDIAEAPVFSDATTGAFSFPSVADGDYTLTTSTSSGFVETTVGVTVAGGAADVGTLTLYRFGTVSGTIQNFSAVHHTMEIWVDQWTGSGWSTVGFALAPATGSDGYAYTVGNAIPGPGYYRVTFEPDAGDGILRTYSGDYAEHFPGDDPSVVGIVGAFEATAYEQSFTGIDVTLALKPASHGGGGSSSGGGGTSSGGSSAHAGGGMASVSSTPDLEPTAESTPTPEALPTTQPQPQPTPEPEATDIAAPATDPDGGAPVDLWLFVVLGLVILLAAGGLGWLVFRRR